MGVKAIVTGHSRGLGAAIVDTLLARAIPVLGLARHCHPSSDPRLSQHMLDLANPQALAAMEDTFRALAEAGLWHSRSNSRAAGVA